MRRPADDNTRVYFETMFLAGVPIYQEPEAADGLRTVRCHGPQSIYRDLLEVLQPAPANRPTT
jgi:hypothetical protein